MPAEQRHPGRLLAVGDDVVEPVEVVDRVVVGDDAALEAQLAAEEVGHDLRRPHDGQAVEVVVRVHDRGQSGLVDGGTKRDRLDITQAPRPEHDLAVVQAAQRAGVAQEVLATAVDPLALHAAHVGDAHAAHQFGVLPVGLLETPPPRVAGDVEDGREREAGTDGADLPPDGDRHLLHQHRVPGRREADGLGEVRGTGGHQPREGLLVGQRRDAQSGPVLEEALDPVDGLGRGNRIEPRARDARDLADAVRQVLRHPLVVELALDEQVGVPDARQLGGLLLERHLPEEVVDVHQKSSSSASRRISVGIVGEKPALGDQLVEPAVEALDVAGLVAVQRPQLLARRTAPRCRP